MEVPGGVGWDRKGSPESNLHVCGEDDTKRAVYNMEECAKKKIGTSKRIVPRRKSYEIKNWACFKEKLIIILVLIHPETLKFNRFSFRFNLVLSYPRSTNLLFRPLAIEPNTSLGSLQIESLQLPKYFLKWYNNGSLWCQINKMVNKFSNYFFCHVFRSWHIFEVNVVKTRAMHRKVQEIYFNILYIFFFFIKH